MGQSGSTTASPTRGDVLQAGLLAARNDRAARAAAEEDIRSGRRLPRSTKVGSRFVIDPDLFPDWVDNISSGIPLLCKWKWGMRGETAPIPSSAELKKLLPVVKPDASALAAPPRNQTQVTWLGHAACLVQWQGWTVLCDPIFSHRCAPVQFAGPARVRPSPVQVEDLPAVDAIVISHNHYDHLDELTVTKLAGQQPDATFFVPLGMRSWFESILPKGQVNVCEMDWGEEVEVPPSLSASRRQQVDSDSTDGATKDSTENGEDNAKDRPPLTIVCVPCQHWCKRTLTDTNKCLWSSWIAKTPGMTYYFGGDTGYCGDMFRRVGNLYPVDFAAIPIGAYGQPAERWFHKPNHQNPEEAVQCHKDLHSRQSLGVHWGTFLLTGEHIMEPPKKLAEAAAEAGLADGTFCVLGHGETRVFDLVRTGPRILVQDGGESQAPSGNGKFK